MASIEKSLKKMFKGVNLKHVLLALLAGLILCVVLTQSREGFTAWSTGTGTGYCESINSVGETCQPNTDIANTAGWSTYCGSRGGESTCGLTVGELLSADFQSAADGTGAIQNQVSDTDFGALSDAVTTANAGGASITGETNVCQYTNTVDVCDGLDSGDCGTGSTEGQCRYKDCSTLNTSENNPLDGIKDSRTRARDFEFLFKCWEKDENRGAIGVDPTTPSTLSEGLPSAAVPILTSGASLVPAVNNPLSGYIVGSTPMATSGTDGSNMTVSGELFPPVWKTSMDGYIEQCSYNHQDREDGIDGVVGFVIGDRGYPKGIECINFNDTIDKLTFDIPVKPKLTVPGCGSCDGSTACEHDSDVEYGNIVDSDCDADVIAGGVVDTLGRDLSNGVDGLRKDIGSFILPTL